MSERIDPTLTEIKDKGTRSTLGFWEIRVHEVGNHLSPFLRKPQEEIDAFTERHRQWVEPWVKEKDVLEIGCGYGRNMAMFNAVRSYMGIEFVHALVQEARENYDKVFKGKESWPKGGIFEVDVRNETMFGAHTFDICVAIAVISSIEADFHEIKRSILNVLRPGGVILWLEEDYTRVEYK